ncbi:ATP-binding protein [Bacillus paralicheniformis]|uniref:ATP-dependent nuclease n=1 Tax=Bacillus paralicheniformis TaxID=1648923 RepID=UPI003D1D0A89
MIKNEDLGLMVERIKEMNQKCIFDNAITKIVFPYFKNYAYHSEINFEFPFTVFVGKNGSGKSSALQALYGAPYGKNIREFWFSTELDPIEEFGEEGERHSYFYEYVKDGEKTEVLYQRMPRENDPDYWETSRPRKKYGMNTSKSKRPELIQKERVYLDFRGELSAFDKFFYFGDVDNLKSKSKQAYLRIKSKQLKKVIEKNSTLFARNKKQNKEVINMKKEELEAISFILQEDYVEGKIIEHKLFGGWGTSVLLNKDTFTYSEAHAGSGEIAVTILVHRILNAPPSSLILLDEPEVSLHPGAQKQLLIFLLDQIKTKRHQVVIATHSPVFTEGLPKNAIKRFLKDPVTKKIDIMDECYPSEAFNFLGLSFKFNSTSILVEDKLAKKIIDSILHEMDIKDVKVNFTSGGANYIKNSLIKFYSQLRKTQNFVLFDGDQKLDEVFDVNDLTFKNKNESFLSGKIREITGQNIKFQKDGGDGYSRDDQIVEAQINYLKYYKDYVEYLPALTPEELIWDEEYISSLLKNSEDIDYICKSGNCKDKFLKTCEKLFGKEVKASHMESLQDMLIKNWISKDSKQKKELRLILDRILEKVNLPILN